MLDVAPWVPGVRSRGALVLATARREGVGAVWAFAAWGLVATESDEGLDDFVWGDDDDPLLGLVSIVKLDVLALGADRLGHAVKHCSAYGVQLVAEQVETRAQLSACQELGFDLFQGYLLSRPEVVAGRALSPNKLTCLRIIEKLCDPDVSAGDVEGIVRTDAALSHRFLQAAWAGAARGFFRL